MKTVQINLGIRAHHVQHIANLIRDGFLRRADDVFLFGKAGHAENRRARIRRPPRRAQSGESGNQINASVVGNARRNFFNFICALDESELVLHPLNRRGRKIDDALERVSWFAAMNPRQRCDRAAFRDARMAADVEQHARASSERGFRCARFVTTLREQRRLRIAHHADNWDLLRKNSVRIGFTKFCRTLADFRQRTHRHVE